MQYLAVAKSLERAISNCRKSRASSTFPSRLIGCQQGKTYFKGTRHFVCICFAPHNPRSQKASAISDAVGRIEEGRSVVRSSPLPEPETVRVFPGFDTFVAKTDSVAPDLRKDLEKMARRRYPPKPFKESAFWWLLCWHGEFVNGVRTRKRERVKLAPATLAAREQLQTRLRRGSRLRHGLSLIR